jgi:hypothetical protein
MMALSILKIKEKKRLIFYRFSGKIGAYVERKNGIGGIFHL